MLEYLGGWVTETDGEWRDIGVDVLGIMMDVGGWLTAQLVV